jgi:hypothetical protein
MPELMILGNSIWSCNVQSVSRRHSIPFPGNIIIEPILALAPIQKQMGKAKKKTPYRLLTLRRPNWDWKKRRETTKIFMNIRKMLCRSRNFSFLCGSALCGMERVQLVWGKKKMRCSVLLWPLATNGQAKCVSILYASSAEICSWCRWFIFGIVISYIDRFRARNTLLTRKVAITMIHSFFPLPTGQRKRSTIPENLSCMY